MGHLILTMHVSADGYIARTDRSLWPEFGWPPAVQGRLNDVYREAGVVVWLNAGVPSTQVAEWAGHSLAVLLQIYAKCLVGQEEAARRRIDAVLGGSDA
jgi:hypothetical protein